MRSKKSSVIPFFCFIKDGWSELHITLEILPIVGWTVSFLLFVLAVSLISSIRLLVLKEIPPPMVVLSLTLRALHQLLAISWGACMPLAVCHVLLEQCYRILLACLFFLVAVASISSALGMSCAISIVLSIILTQHPIV